MEGRVRGDAGGIDGLLELIDEHAEAVEYELIAAGLRLRDIPSERFNWRDLYVLVRRWQKLPGNALAASVLGHEAPSWTEQVFAEIVDLLQAIDFHIRKGKGARPSPFTRWWKKLREQRFGRDPIPMAEFDDWWDSAGKK